MMRGPRGACLLYTGSRIPYWPLDAWAKTVGEVLQYVSPSEHLNSFCVALNNAALIELHLGRPAQARALCLAQIDLLLAMRGEVRTLASRYIWQPIINVLRLDSMVSPAQCRTFFSSLSRALHSRQPSELPEDLQRGIAFALESASETGIQHWIHEIAFTEPVIRCLKANDQQVLVDMVHDAEHSEHNEHSAILGHASHMSPLLAEINLLLSFWRDGLIPVEGLHAPASYPYVMSMCQLLRWFSATNVQAVSGTDILPLLRSALDAILNNDGARRSNHELIGWLTLSLAELSHAQGYIENDVSLMQRVLHLFEEIEDEIWQFRILVAMPLVLDIPQKLSTLQKTARYREIAGSKHGGLSALPYLREKLILNTSVSNLVTVA
jgi:hypothetical protein